MSDAYLAFTADSAQQHNPAGALWIIKINTEHFMKPWPAAGDVVNGVIVKMPLLRADAGLPRITPVPGTLFYKDSLVGRYGHQFYRHELGYEVANDTAAINLELEKDINSTAVFIIGKSDGTMRVLGKSSAGLQVNNESDSGVEGGENKTTVKAISNVQTRKKLVLSPALETQILSGSDGYGLAFRIQGGTGNSFPMLIQPSTTTYTINLNNINGGSTGRRFAVNDLVELRRAVRTQDPSNPALFNSVSYLGREAGYMTARVSSVSNNTGQPAGFVDRIILSDLLWFNFVAGPEVTIISATNISVAGSLIIQKL